MRGEGKPLVAVAVHLLFLYDENCDCVFFFNILSSSLLGLTIPYAVYTALLTFTETTFNFLLSFVCLSLLMKLAYVNVVKKEKNQGARNAGWCGHCVNARLGIHTTAIRIRFVVLFGYFTSLSGLQSLCPCQHSQSNRILGLFLCSSFS